MNYFPRQFALILAGMFVALLTGCSALRPTPVAPPAFYAVGSGTSPALRVPRTAAPERNALPTLLVSAPHAAAAFDSQRIIYQRQAFRLEYFAHSEWVEPPARMLAPLMVAALDRSGVFRAVVATPSSVAADLRLDTELVVLQHEFGSTPSRVRLTLRATLSDNSSRQVLGQVDLEHLANASSEDAYGGVIAANQATQSMLQALTVFCNQAVARWTSLGGTPAKGAVRRF